MSFNADLFDRAWALYDEKPPFFKALGQRLVSFAAPTTGSCVLEVGAGKGAVTIPLLHAVGERGRVSAVDVSSEMAQALGAYAVPGLDVYQADVTSLPFADESFDHAFSGFTLHIVSDLVAALREVRRTLKAGGTLCWSMPGTHPDAQEWQDEYGAIFARFGARLPNVPEEMDDDGDLEADVAAAGFDLTQTDSAPTCIPVGGAEEYWDWTQSHGARWLTDALDPDCAVELRQAVIDSLRRLHPTQGDDIMVAPTFFRLRRQDT